MTIHQVKPGAGSEAFYLEGFEKIWQKRWELGWAWNNGRTAAVLGNEGLCLSKGKVSVEVNSIPHGKNNYKLWN